MATLQHDPHWPRASAWLAGDLASDVRSGAALAILGAPLALGSITPGRCDLAPAAVRAALTRFSTFDAERDCDLKELRVSDLGDLGIAPLHPEAAFDPIRKAVGAACLDADAVVILGGDNSITRPACHGVTNPADTGQQTKLDRLGLITLDAHLDLRHLDDGLNNGNPIRALLADGLPGRNLTQIGVQPFVNSQEYLGVAKAAGISVITAGEARQTGFVACVAGALERLEATTDQIYVDLDLDVLDRAFAPACPGARPGGFLPHEIQQAVYLCGRSGKVRALDLVEIDPSKDIGDVTVLCAAQCLLCFASGLMARDKMN